MNSDWHPEDIKSEIRKRGSTLAALARRHGLSKATLGACITRRASENGDLIIADFLGLKPHQIWPSRYKKNGERIRLLAPRQRERQAA